MRRLFLATVVLSLPACGPTPHPSQTADTPAGKAGAPAPAGAPASSLHEGDAVTADEKKVKAFILDNADDPKSVEFARWGPNATPEKALVVKTGLQRTLFELVLAEHKNGKMIVRARCRLNNQNGVKVLQDKLYLIDADGNVADFSLGGLATADDHWLDPAKEQEDDSVLTWGQYSQLKNDMTREEVQKVMGSAPTVEMDMDNARTEAWKDGDDFITVKFYKGKAESAHYKLTHGAPKTTGGGDLP